MPETKGKRRNRGRRRPSGAPYSTAPATHHAPASVPAPAPRRGLRRRGWQPPLWYNIFLGVISLAAGIWLFQGVIQHHTKGFQAYLPFLYFLLAAMTLVRAYTQIKARRSR